MWSPSLRCIDPLKINSYKKNFEKKKIEKKTLKKKSKKSSKLKIFTMVKIHNIFQEKDS